MSEFNARLIGMLQSGAAILRNVSYERDMSFGGCPYWEMRVDFVIDASKIPTDPDQEFQRLLQLAFVDLR